MWVSAESPFSTDPNWLNDFPEAEQASKATGQPMLILFYSTSNRDTERLETDLARWTGVPERLGSFVRVTLKVEDHRDLATACKVFSVPSLAILSHPDRPEISQRLLGTLENTTNREAVVQFLETGSMMTSIDPGEIFAQAAQVKSASQILEEAETALEARDYPQAFEGFEKAVRMLPAGTSEQHLKLHLKLADLYYKAGQFAEAIDHYRKALESLPKEKDRERALHIFSRLALLLNDQGENEEAVKYLAELEGIVEDPERLEEIAEEKKAFAAGLYVLAGRGYPGVGLEPPAGAGGVADASEEAELPFEQKLERAVADLDHIETILRQAFERDGSLPNFLDEIPSSNRLRKRYPRIRSPPGFPTSISILKTPRTSFSTRSVPMERTISARFATTQTKEKRVPETSSGPSGISRQLGNPRE